ncbi:MAG: LON peptidase substrate-binding domain-containing protein [Rhodobacteraceae bacterium]|nr:LON peptidase substrate-binding domain-containing protein [Paracoccaceae bacterium]MCP5342451.1 LON peptidase substrate-binding domain-containing protein [Paracoccaceae bacterium]
MKIRGDLPDKIPLFPLPGALLLPRAVLPLQIFEPRYLALLDDCLKTSHRLIGMIQPRPVPEGREELSSIGCAGRVTAFSETDDGRYRITLTGISRFRLKEAVAGFAPYVSGEVSWDGFGRDRGQPEKDAGFHRKEFMALLQRYFSSRNLATDWESLQGADDELLINSLSMLCPFAAEDRQALLEAPSLQTRRETLITLMEFALHSGGEDPMQ